jgi:drug/metabolite transporter (DMT)-like permease
LASLIFSRLGSQLGSTLLNFFKCALALIALMFTRHWLEGQGWPVALDGAALGWLALSGVIGLTLGDTVFFGGLQLLGARRTLLIGALAPPITALLAWPILGEAITARMLLGMALTMGGVAWVILERTTETSDAQAAASHGQVRLGMGLAALSALCQALGNVLTKFGGGAASGLSISIVRLAAGVLGLLVLLAWQRRLRSVLEPLKKPRLMGLVSLATLLGTYLGLWLLMVGLQNAPAGVAATLVATSPIFILPLSAWIDRERLTTRAVAGAVLAVAGVALLF